MGGEKVNRKSAGICQDGGSCLGNLSHQGVGSINFPCSRDNRDLFRDPVIDFDEYEYMKCQESSTEGNCVYGQCQKDCNCQQEPSSARRPRDFSSVDGTTVVENPSTKHSEPDIWYDVSTGFDRYSSYAPIIVNNDLQCETTYSSSFPANELGSQLNIPGWLHELRHENDLNLRDYLSYGVQNGFLVVDSDAEIPTYECKNYGSVSVGPAHDFVDKLINSELVNGKYIISKSKPHCIHALGAVPKRDSLKWRPITDCKRPIGVSINSHMSSTYREFCYTSVDRVIDMVKPGYFMASVDIAAAYRSILIHPSNWKYQGIVWDIDGVPTYLCDTHLCFGIRCAPYLFTQVTNFVLRCLQRRGFSLCTVYLDDFLVMGESESQCLEAQLTLISILRSLGFYIAWDKCVAPTKCITYLGVTFDSNEMTVSLPTSKMERLHREIAFFLPKNRATKRQIQQLCGILSHCSKIVKGGRTFSHRIIELLKDWPHNRKRIRLGDCFKHDLYWWRDFSSEFNGKNLMVSYNYGMGPCFYTDSCIAGYGLWSDLDWQAGYFNASITPNISSLDPSHHHWMNIHVASEDSASNINVLELIPVWLCIKRNAHLWSNLHVICYTDNQSVFYMVNKGHSSNSECMRLIRDLFWDCASHNLHLTCRFIPGRDNHLADFLSRIFFTNDVSFIADFSLCCSTQASG